MVCGKAVSKCLHFNEAHMLNECILIIRLIIGDEIIVIKSEHSENNCAFCSFFLVL
jgi:hypothetical protein